MCGRLACLSGRSWQEFRDHFGIGRGMVLPPSAREEFEARPRGEKAAAPMLRGEALPDEVQSVHRFLYSVCVVKCVGRM